MKSTKRKKLMLSTSIEGDVIVANVKPTQIRNRGEYFVSEDFVRLNEENGTLTDMTGKFDIDGRIYILTADLN
tara:strand:+ start:609 stop:827 length:219 start_codon:yes stop_codon:yes gene_type:complete